MKKIFILFFLIIAPFLIFGQFFRSQFDKMDALRPYGFSNTDDAADLGWGEGYIMQSYLIMYKATKDIYYLNKFCIHSKNVMEHRQTDEFQAWKYPSNDTFPDWYQISENGMITYPMAEFVYLIEMEETNLSNVELPKSSIEFCADCNTFGDYATWLKERVIETLDEFIDNDNKKIDEWKLFPNCSSSIDYPIDYYSKFYCYSGFYKGTNFFTNALSALNKQAAIARTFLVMSQLTTESTRDNYLFIGGLISQQFKNALVSSGDSYSWYHKLQSFYNHELKEDISHGAIDIELAVLCNKFGVTLNGEPIFTDADLSKLANTFMLKLYQSPGDLNLTVFGDNDEEHCDISDSPLIEEYGGRWLPLVEYSDDRNDYIASDIYNVISDIYFEKCIINPNWDHEGWRLLGLAYLTYYQNLFNPIAIYKGFGTGNQWAGINSGDFDGDGTDEIIAARNYDGNFIIFELDSENNIVYKYRRENNPNDNWADITGGNIDGGDKDEILATRNSDKRILAYSLNSSDQIEFKTSILIESSSEIITGVACGNVDGIGDEEIIVLTEGSIEIYKFINNAFQLFKTKHLYVEDKMVALTCEDFDLDGKDEIAVARNWDGSIVLFELNSAEDIGFKTTLSTNLGTEWTDIGSGDFDGDGMPEIIAHTNYDGNIHFIKYENEQLVLKNYQEYFTSGQLLDNIGSGNFSAGKSSEQIVTLRNYSDALSVYTMEGICYGASFNELIRDTDFGQIDYHIPNSIDAGGEFIVPSGSSVEFVSGSRITLSKGFKVESGAEFVAKIGNSGNLSCGNSPYLKSSSTINIGNSINNIELVISESDMNRDKSFDSNINLYPNPSNGIINIETNFDKFKLEVVYSNGRMIESKQFNSSYGQINLDGQPKGLYLLKIITDNSVLNRKIIYN